MYVIIGVNIPIHSRWNHGSSIAGDVVESTDMHYERNTTGREGHQAEYTEALHTDMIRYSRPVTLPPHIIMNNYPSLGNHWKGIIHI